MASIIRCTVLSDTGRRRTHNEDAGLAIVPEPGAGWGFDAALVVCDGVGGAAGGEVASATTVEHLKRSFSSASSEPVAERIRSAVDGADAHVREYAQREAGGAQVGTTVVVGVVANRSLTVAHAGDSRAYLVRGREIIPLTTDHSFVAEQVKAGIILATEARTHPLRSRITRAVGMGEESRVDVREVPLTAGDVVLLCTDGLHGLVEDGEIAGAVVNDLEATARRLVELANERGGTDNITVAVCRIA